MHFREVNPIPMWNLPNSVCGGQNCLWISSQIWEILWVTNLVSVIYMGWITIYHLNPFASVITKEQKEDWKWIFLQNIARGTTDPGYWVQNLNNLFQLKSFKIDFIQETYPSHRLNTLGPLCLWQCFQLIFNFLSSFLQVFVQHFLSVFQTFFLALHCIATMPRILSWYWVDIFISQSHIN